MRFFALLTPVAMLAALWMLQRLEAWMSHPGGRTGRGSSRSVARHTTERSADARQQRREHV